MTYPFIILQQIFNFDNIDNIDCLFVEFNGWIRGFVCRYNEDQYGDKEDC
jgi:hypothetical protein